MVPDQSTNGKFRTVVVIPARYASTRFPGKPLALICGIPMIVRVLRQAQRAKEIDAVIVATDSESIRETVEKHGGQCVMTSANLATGTDRVAVATADLECDYVVNLQGDEPLINPAHITLAVQGLHNDPQSVVSTLASPIQTRDDLLNPNIVKVLVNAQSRATFFSRTPIPYSATQTYVDYMKYHRHIGLYVYRRQFLQEFVSLKPSWSEQVEKLEQLRVLHYGGLIQVSIVQQVCPGVDTPEDVIAIEHLLTNGYQISNVREVRDGY